MASVEPTPAPEFEAPNVAPLSFELAEKARNELRETDEVRSRMLLLVRQHFLQTQQGLLPRDDDAFLLRFLRARKYDFNRTVELLINYCKYRRDHPNLFQAKSEELELVLNKRIINLLPNRDKNGCAIVLISTRNINFKETPFDMLMRCLIYLCEKVIDDPAIQVNGVVVLYDLGGYPMGLLSAITSAEKRSAMQWTENCFPIRFNGAHIINEPWYVTVILAVVRTFTTKKILSRVFLYGSNYAALRQHFDETALPPPFGSLETFDPLQSFAAELAALKRAEGKEVAPSSSVVTSQPAATPNPPAASSSSAAAAASTSAQHADDEFQQPEGVGIAPSSQPVRAAHDLIKPPESTNPFDD